MKAFVTGGAGFIGTRLIAELTRLGHRVVAPSRADLDITDPSALRAAVRTVAPDWVFHLAALTTGNEDEMTRVNVGGTTHVIDAAADISVRAIIVAGTNMEYGDVATPFLEETIPHPMSAYGRTKLEATYRALEKNSVVPVTVLRFSNVYGPGGRSFIEKLREALRAGTRVQVSDTAVRDFIHVDDVVQALIAAAVKIDTVRGQVINICSGEVYTTAELVRTAAQMRGVPLGRVMAQEPYILALTDQISNAASNARARELLGWSAQISLKQELSRE